MRMSHLVPPAGSPGPYGSLSSPGVSRRSFLAASVLAARHLAAAKPAAFKGVVFGAESFSFRDMSLDGCIDAMRTLGLTQCELFRGHVQPPKEPKETWAQYGERMRGWMRTVPPDIFVTARDKFRKAGIAVCGFDHSPAPDYSDEEINRAFELTKILKVKYMMTSSHVSVASRLNAFAIRHRLLVAYHNHSNLVPDEPTRPEDLERAIDGNSHIRIAFDIGHFVAAGFDPIAFLEKNHSRITALHVKDRHNNQGPNVPFGEGDTPLSEVLRLVQRNKYRMPVLIEYEYPGRNSLEEVRRCLDYVKRVLT